MTKVCLCQVLAADMSLVEDWAVEVNMLPNTCNQSQARMLAAWKVISHDFLLDEITRWMVIKFVEEEDDVMDCWDDDNPVSSDKESDSDSSEILVDKN